MITLADPRTKLQINEKNLKEINTFLLKKDNALVNRLLEIVEKYGGVKEINKKANAARDLNYLMHRLEKKKSPFSRDLEWLIKQREKEAFISIPNYRKKIVGDKTALNEV